MKWRRLYWLLFPAAAVVIVTLAVELTPEDHVNCRFYPNAKSCVGKAEDTGMGVLVVIFGVVLVALWVSWRWQLRKRKLR